MATKKTTVKSKDVKKASTAKTVKAASKKATTTKKAPVSKNVKAKYFAAVGRRKTAVARVRIQSGSGAIVVNEKELKVFFPDKVWQNKVKSPLLLTGLDKTMDVSVKTHGGGVNSQAEATRHGISRALERYDAELRASLKKAGFLTRDAREKERKKYGLKRARRAPQFSKR